MPGYLCNSVQQRKDWTTSQEMSVRLDHLVTLGKVWDFMSMWMYMQFNWGKQAPNFLSPNTKECFSYSCPHIDIHVVIQGPGSFHLLALPCFKPPPQTCPIQQMGRKEEISHPRFIHCNSVTGPH